MMSAINEAILVISSSLAASIIAKSTVTTALALIVARLARRSRAAVRHALLAAAFGVLLVLPIASLVAPPVRIAVQADAQERIAPGFTGAIANPAAAAPHAGVGVSSGRPRLSGLSLTDLLLMGWIAGVALFLLPMGMGLRQVRSVRRSALPWRSGQPIVEGLAFDAGVHRRVELLLHEGLSGPITCGVVHPAIVVPPDAQTWEGEDLNRAIVHELEHVRRADRVSQCVARALCAVYWFHPLVWIAWRQLALEAERACDDAVLARSEATAYADQLVGLAQRLSRAPKSPLLAMASRADLATRVGAVLDSRQLRGRAGALRVALAGVAAAILVLTMSPLRIVAAPQSTDVQVTPMPQFSANVLLVIVAVTVTDQNGTNIEGLSANDFAVTEEGVPQTISAFEFQKPAGAPQGRPDSISSYYILGYYTNDQNADGQFRRVEITGRASTMARLRYRPGYYSHKGGFGVGDGGDDGHTGLDGTPPVLLYKKAPEYSEEARKAKYQGTVTLQVEVDPSGTVTNHIKVVRALGLGLDEKAVDAVRQWKFRPAVKDGRPVSVQAQVAVNFRLL